MKRFHCHVCVEDLRASVDFYSTLFDAEPIVLKRDYAKWVLDDPAVNFAISARGVRPGVDHLGIQTESDEARGRIEDRLQAVHVPGTPETATTCCYAVSDKYWITDPQGVPWEVFHTLSEAPTFSAPEEGASCRVDAAGAGGPCCGGRPE